MIKGNDNPQKLKLLYVGLAFNHQMEYFIHDLYGKLAIANGDFLRQSRLSCFPLMLTSEFEEL